MARSPRSVGPKRSGAAGAPGAGRTAADTARAHQATRKAHAQETAEDYAEAIADLIESEGEARVVDLADRLGVSHVTVVRTIARLQREGLVVTRPYRSIHLTDRGREMAEDSARRHEVVVRFLRALGISEATAQADAEGIEHHVSEETLAAFARFADGRWSPRRG
ncbi:MAG: manganese-binding transcriptional regulator MntR [Phycisphaeraceae bacterium]|nr:manganese-binding transcriptional regulator MntR [Phycisphaeraceae bacterium]MBX3406764.1 manganese-binding transcriptional regulator MntR [Phycisphaeraceae bacterium]